MAAVARAVYACWMSIPQYTAVVIKGPRTRHALLFWGAGATTQAACGKRSSRWLVATIDNARTICRDCKLAMGLPCRRASKR